MNFKYLKAKKSNTTLANMYICNYQNCVLKSFFSLATFWRWF